MKFSTKSCPCSHLEEMPSNYSGIWGRSWCTEDKFHSSKSSWLCCSELQTGGIWGLIYCNRWLHWFSWWSDYCSFQQYSQIQSGTGSAYFHFGNVAQVSFLTHCCQSHEEQCLAFEISTPAFSLDPVPIPFSFLPL
jgi:hypothetical protein